MRIRFCRMRHEILAGIRPSLVLSSGFFSPRSCPLTRTAAAWIPTVAITTAKRVVIIATVGHWPGNRSAQKDEMLKRISAVKTIRLRTTHLQKVKPRFTEQTRFSRGPRSPNRGDGIDFVRCRICDDHRRVISGRHLSKHGTDREEYMDEYGLSPDKLIAKDFRRIQSSRRGYQPYGRRDWIAAIKKLHTEGEVCLPETCKTKTRASTSKAFGFLVIGMRHSAQQASSRNGCGCVSSGTIKRLSRKCAAYESKIYRFTPIT
jgi:hypothetical protein